MPVHLVRITSFLASSLTRRVQIPGTSHLLEGLAALLSNLVLVAFGDLVEGSTLQPEMHLGGCWLAALPNNLPHQS